MQFLNFVDEGIMQPWRQVVKRKQAACNVIGRDSIEVEFLGYNATGCTENASLTEIANTTSTPFRTQSFQVGTCVLEGYLYNLMVYSHLVQVAASASDTPTSIANKLAAAVNATTAAGWNSSGSAPPASTPGSKPMATSSNDKVNILLNIGNQFAGYASGSAPIEEEPEPPAPPPPPPPQEPIAPEVVENEAPTAVILPVSPVTLPNSVCTLDGSNSTDPEGDTLSYAWTQQSGPATAGISNPSAQVTQVTGLQAGNYVFQLEVDDGNGNTDSTTVSVSVSAAENEQPIAVAGATQTIYLPTDAVNLDGSESSDPEHGVLAFQWEWVSGPSEPTFINPNKAVAQVKELIEGTYEFRLTVIDPLGATDQALTKVFVLPQEKEVIYKTSILGGPYGGGGMGGGGGGGSASSGQSQGIKPKSLLLLALAAIAVSFIFFKKDSIE